MIVFPNCKINLGLQILRRRPDGFHDLNTVFYPVPLQDALEIIHQTEGRESRFHLSGMSLDIGAEDNICFKAWQVLKKDFPELPPVNIHLHKTIPTGAGLGGGSADGAFTLLVLNKKFNLGLTEEQLIEYALQLGSDCPFFIKNKPCFATGRGEQMEELELDLSDYKMVLINPGIHVNTGWAFRQIKPNDQRDSLRKHISLPVIEWKYYLQNDFEAPVITAHPEVGNIRSQLYDQQATYAAMSGSGSTVFGLFPKNATPTLNFPEHYFVRWV